MADDLTLTVAGRSISGWNRARVTRGLERTPSDFDIAMTERFPGAESSMVVKPGDPCQVSIGGDMVITGYIDRVMPGIGPRRHPIRIVGRGMCQDLVDCSAEWPGGQIKGETLLGIAQKLANPYGIDVTADADTGGTIPQFNLIHGESAFEIIERLCRWKGLIAYDRPDGGLKLAQAGTKRAGSGFAEGENVQAAGAVYAMDGRYSDVYCYLQGTDVLDDTGSAGNQFFRTQDKGVPRHRRLDLVSESGGGGQDICKKRALWEVARRGGRAFQVSVTADAWRDIGGKLWEPNTLAPIYLPSLKVPDKAEWLIGEVTYRLDEEGTNADVLLMPKEAFLPEPFLLQPQWVDVPPGAGAQQ